MADKTMTEEELKRQKKVIASGKAFDCYLFASTTDGCDVKALEQLVITSGTAYDCYIFARDVKGANIKALQKALQNVAIDSIAIHYCYLFAIYIDGADTDVLIQYIIDCSDDTCRYRIAMNWDNTEMVGYFIYKDCKITLMEACRWHLTYDQGLLSIGCKTKSIDGWNDWFKSDAEYDAERGTDEFQLILKAFVLFNRILKEES